MQGFNICDSSGVPSSCCKLVLFKCHSSSEITGLGVGFWLQLHTKSSSSALFSSERKIKEIRAEGISGSNSVKVILDGEGEMQKIEISDEVLKDEKSILEDLIVAAYNNAKAQLKAKTNEEISKATGGLGIPGFKWPF